jgi:death-on-curing protein
MILLTADEIITLHAKLTAATGGSGGLRDRGLLESAVFGCYQSFGGKELYPGVIEKAARLAFGICANHPFIDGNKRAAMTALLTVLRLNDIDISYTQKELAALGLGVASGSFGYEALVEWVRSHLALQS